MNERSPEHAWPALVPVGPWPGAFTRILAPERVIAALRMSCSRALASGVQLRVGPGTRRSKGSTRAGGVILVDACAASSTGADREIGEKRARP